MPKFRKKPVVIEAVQWTGKNGLDVMTFACEAITQNGKGMPYIEPDGRIEIQTLEGEVYSSEGDWIIKGIKGEFYPCKPDIFEATYERVQETKYTMAPNELNDPKVQKAVKEELKKGLPWMS